jgi:hypothetical protein
MCAVNFVQEKPWVVVKFGLLFLFISFFSWYNFEQLFLGMLLAAAITAIALANWRVFDEASDALLDIQEEDSVKEKGVKVATTMGARIVYICLDYGLAAVSVALVIAMKNFGYSFWQTVITMWVMIDITSAGATVWIYEKTGRDITLGRSYRRMWNVVMQHSRRAGIVMLVYECTLAAFWAGPDYTVLFFRDELATRKRMAIALVAITIIHSVIWTTVYWFSYDNIVDLVKFFIN